MSIDFYPAVNSHGAAAGTAVASAGDTDGDGLGDFLIGAPGIRHGEDVPHYGSLFLVPGAALGDLVGTDPAAGGIALLERVAGMAGAFEFRGTGTFGYTSSGVGASLTHHPLDIDGDGLGDLIIGASRAEVSRLNPGAVFVVPSSKFAEADAHDGTTDGIIELIGIEAVDGIYAIEGRTRGGLFGTSVDALGDIDGDGLDDFAIGAENDFGQSGQTGAAHLVAAGDLAALDAADGLVDGVISRSTLATGAQSYSLLGAERRGDTGADVAGGDFDGDGVGDLLLGAARISTVAYRGGAVWLVPGSALADADLADGTRDHQIAPDRIIGSEGVYVFYGTKGRDYIGTNVASAGDLDGDGLDDILIGAARSGPDGRAYVVMAADLAAIDALDGAADGQILLNNVRLSGASYQIDGTGAEGEFGRPVASAGDVDGDGLDDLLVGGAGIWLDPTTGGEAFLLFGSALEDADQASGRDNGRIRVDALTDPGLGYTFDGPLGGGRTGGAVATAGDVDGDGKDDLLVGSYHAGAQGWRAGAAHLIFGDELAVMDARDGAIDGHISVLSDPRIGDGDGDARLKGTAAPDFLTGAMGDDTLRGGAGRDTLTGDTGDDLLIGGKGGDTLRGGLGDDTLRGGAGNDVIDGGTGYVFSEGGSDRLFGGAGDDTLSSHGGRIIGGAGDDVYIGRDLATQPTLIFNKTDWGRDTVIGDWLDFRIQIHRDLGEAQTHAQFLSAVTEAEDGLLVYDWDDDGRNVIVFDGIERFPNAYIDFV